MEWNESLTLLLLIASMMFFIGAIVLLAVNLREYTKIDKKLEKFDEWYKENKDER